MDWADEFDTNGFKIVSEEYYNLLKAAVESDGSYEDEYYFGTNEFFDLSVKDIFNSYDVQSISEEEAQILEKLFGTKEWGIFITPVFKDYYDSDEKLSEEELEFIKYTENNGS
jgi:hypothetical protein